MSGELHGESNPMFHEKAPACKEEYLDAFR